MLSYQTHLIAFLEKKRNVSSFPSAKFWHEWSLFLSDIQGGGCCHVSKEKPGLASRLSESENECPSSRSSRSQVTRVLEERTECKPTSRLCSEGRWHAAVTLLGASPGSSQRCRHSLAVLPPPGWSVLALGCPGQSCAHISRRVTEKAKHVRTLIVSLGRKALGKHWLPGAPLPQARSTEESVEAGCSERGP